MSRCVTIILSYLEVTVDTNIGALHWWLIEIHLTTCDNYLGPKSFQLLNMQPRPNNEDRFVY